MLTDRHLYYVTPHCQGHKLASCVSLDLLSDPLGRLFIEHWDIEKRHRTVFIEGSAIAGFSKALGSNVVFSFSSLPSSIPVAWVTSESNVQIPFHSGSFKSVP